MKASSFTRYASMAVVWESMLLSVGSAAVGTDAEVLLNRHWAEQAFSETPVEVKPANSLVIIHEDVAGDTKLGRCAAVEGPPMRLADKVYQHGIGVNSLSVIRVILEKPAKKFTSVIGLDQNVDNTAASVRFHVGVDGKDVFATDTIKAGAISQAIEVPLNGAKSFDLTVDVGGDNRNWDQADWADAKVVLQDGSELWLDDIARQATPVGGLPFSFVYGGKHSSELVNEWKREVNVEKVGDTIDRRTLTLADPTTGLEVKAVCTICLDTAGVDWTVHFTNKGSQDSPALEKVRAVDAAVGIGMGTSAVIHRLNGAPCLPDDWMPFDQAVPAGRRVEFAATKGRSSNVSPWFNIDWGVGGVITAIGWSGCQRAVKTSQ